MFQSVTFLRASKIMDFHIPISYISQVSSFWLKWLCIYITKLMSGFLLSSRERQHKLNSVHSEFVQRPAFEWVLFAVCPWSLWAFVPELVGECWKKVNQLLESKKRNLFSFSSAGLSSRSWVWVLNQWWMLQLEDMNFINYEGLKRVYSVSCMNLEILQSLLW